MQILTLLLPILLIFNPGKFKTEQLKQARVSAAYQEKKTSMEKDLKDKKVSINNFELYLRAFKYEEELEVWIKKESDKQFQLFKIYPFCTNSGTLGPKRKQGDRQIPEGIYAIDRFNPWSSYHLSLGINYPNKADKIKGNGNLGGDIFIHGSCVSIGCISITDDKIKEVYLLSVEAINNGQASIPVHIFPGRFGTVKFSGIEKQYADNKELTAFWKNLKEGYHYFTKSKTLPIAKVLANGNYSFQ